MSVNYLLIPRQYVAKLADPPYQWSENADAIIDSEWNTLVLSASLAQFIEGGGARDRLVHFGFTIHFLHRLLRVEGRLQQAWKDAGGSMRNAGVLFAELTHAMPRTPESHDVRAISRALRRPEELVTLHFLSVQSSAPPVSPRAFNEHLDRQIGGLSDDALRHWFRHGRGPKVADVTPIELPKAPLRKPDGALEEALKRKRLAGVAPFVDQMISALALPPRRVQLTELPVGGYSSVTNRGHPDQILFSEFAVDELEFLRRYAENELLYYQREEPQSQVREDTVVLLDQGVRTWGEPRLALTAAAIAFGKRSQRRGMPVRFAATSNHGELVESNDDELIALLESSDLSPNPGIALERVLEEPAFDARDVVLLTHPRNLAEGDVGIAARRAGGHVRLFCLTVDEDGRAELSEIRRGAPVSLRTFQIHAPPERPRSVHTAEPDAPWTGPFEPTPWPFRFGTIGGVRHITMDREGARLYTVCGNGLLHAWTTDGDDYEILPRPALGNLPPEPVGAVGVRGGFVAAYASMDDLVIVHYDQHSRRARIHNVPHFARPKGVWLDYLEGFHTMTCRSGSTVFIDLDTGEQTPGANPDARVAAAYREHRESGPQAPQVQVALSSGGSSLKGASSGRPTDLPSKVAPSNGIQVLHDQNEGRLAVRMPESDWESWRPLSDGGPLLKGAGVREAVCAGGTLALRIRRGQHEHVLLMAGPEWRMLGQFNTQAGLRGLVISDDGLNVAYQSRPGTVIGFNLENDPERRFSAFPARVHSELELEAGDRWFTVYGGKFTHLVRWDRERLEVAFLQGRRDVTEFIRRKRDAAALDPKRVRARPGATRETGEDVNRFSHYAYSPSGLQFATTRYGEVAAFDGEKLLAMFYVYRGTVAAWLPDGTRYGPAGITGGPTTPDALGKIGRAMKAGR